MYGMSIPVPEQIFPAQPYLALKARFAHAFDHVFDDRLLSVGLELPPYCYAAQVFTSADWRMVIWKAQRLDGSITINVSYGPFAAAALPRLIEDAWAAFSDLSGRRSAVIVEALFSSQQTFHWAMEAQGADAWIDPGILFSDGSKVYLSQLEKFPVKPEIA